MIFITQTNFSVSGTQVVQQIGKAEAGLLNKWSCLDIHTRKYHSWFVHTAVTLISEFNVPTPPLESFKSFCNLSLIIISASFPLNLLFINSWEFNFPIFRVFDKVHRGWLNNTTGNNAASHCMIAILSADTLRVGESWVKSPFCSSHQPLN